MPLSEGTIKVVLWNCRNFGNGFRGRGMAGNVLEKAVYLMEYLKTRQIDLACLMETQENTVETIYTSTMGKPRDKDGKLLVDLSTPVEFSSNGYQNNPDYRIWYTENYKNENYLFITHKDLNINSIWTLSLNDQNLQINDNLNLASVRSCGAIQLGFELARDRKSSIGIGVFHAPSSYGNRNIEGRKTVMGEMVDWFKDGFANCDQSDDPNAVSTECDLWIWSGDFNFRKDAKKDEYQFLRTIMTSKGYVLRGPLKNPNSGNATPAETSLRTLQTMLGLSKTIPEDQEFANPFDQVWARRENRRFSPEIIPEFGLKDLVRNENYIKLTNKTVFKMEKQTVEGLEIFLTSIANPGGKNSNQKARNNRMRELKKLMPKAVKLVKNNNNDNSGDVVNFGGDRFEKNKLGILEVFQLQLNYIYTYFKNLKSEPQLEDTLENIKAEAIRRLQTAVNALRVSLQTFNSKYTKTLAYLTSCLIEVLIEKENINALGLNDRFWVQIVYERKDSPYSIFSWVIMPLLNYSGLIAHNPSLAGYQINFSDHFPVEYTINTREWENKFLANMDPLDDSSSDESNNDDQKENVAYGNGTNVTGNDSDDDDDDNDDLNMEDIDLIMSDKQ